MNTTKKVQEEDSVRLLFETLELECDDLMRSEGPDFVAVVAGRSIAIEVTRAFHPNREGRPRQAEETERAKVIERAFELWKQEEGGRVDVQVSFNSNHELRGAVRDRLPKTLVEIVKARLPTRDNAVVEYNWASGKWFPDELESIRIARYETLSQSHWTLRDAEYVAPLTHDLVQERIDEKAQADYGAQHDEWWLLIVLESDRRLSATFRVQGDVLNEDYEGPFDRALVLDRWSRRSWDLGSKTEEDAPAETV